MKYFSLFFILSTLLFLSSCSFHKPFVLKSIKAQQIEFVNETVNNTDKKELLSEEIIIGNGNFFDEDLYNKAKKESIYVLHKKRMLLERGYTEDEIFILACIIQSNPIAKKLPILKNLTSFLNKEELRFILAVKSQNKIFFLDEDSDIVTDNIYKLELSGFKLMGFSTYDYKHKIIDSEDEPMNFLQLFLAKKTLKG